MAFTAPAHSYPHRGRQAILSDPDGATFAVLASDAGDPPDFLTPPGGFIWSSLLVADPSRELAFYKTLFGYQVFDLAADTDGGAGVTPGAGKHYVLASDDYARAGLNALPEDSKHRRPHWLDFVRVDDAAAAASKAATLGGRILVEPRPDRHGGKLAVLADPTGAVFGVMEWPQGESKEEPQ